MSEELLNITPDRLDELEAEMLANYPEVECHLHHEFTPGLYSREILMPAGTLIVSRIHNTEHPYIVMSGVVHVKINDGEWERIEGPCRGITKPGTRRVLYVEENTAWITFHPTTVMPEDSSQNAILEAVDKVDNQILEKHINPILQGELKNNLLTNKQLYV